MKPADLMHFALWLAELEADRGCADAMSEADMADWQMRRAPLPPLD